MLAILKDFTKVLPLRIHILTGIISLRGSFINLRAP